MRTIRLAGPRSVFPGFTLVELLAVIAAAAVAVVIAAPAFTRLGTDATLDACLSNQRAIATGWGHYATDYNYVVANFNDSLTAGRPQPTDYQYGSFAVWLRLMGTEDQSIPVGAGHFLPYLDKGVFTCPGNPAGDDYFKRFLFSDPDHPYQGGWERQGFTAYSTYYYRGGVYYRETYPFQTPVDLRFAFLDVKRPDQPAVQDKPFLTCHWSQGRFEVATRWGISHGGTAVNLAYPDGHAATWTLPQDMTPLMAFYERQGAALFAGEDFDCNDSYKQLPWWWVRADHRSAE